ncbi:MAG: response regulator [Bacteroidaceae bacterium]|nr:response regulator [Bacteroidaceae bacterium]
MSPFTVIIVEDVKLELKGTQEIFRSEIPEATILGTAQNESEVWKLFRQQVPDLLLLDLGLGGSTTVGVDICRQVRQSYPSVRVLVFTGEVLNERLWVEVLNAGAAGIVLKTGELLTRNEVKLAMNGRNYVFNEPILEKIIARYKRIVCEETLRTDALIHYDIDEYDEIYLRHLALGYTKDMIAQLRTMPFGTKSLEKRQAELIGRLFSESERQGVNATRLVVRALQLHILDLDNLHADD